MKRKRTNKPARMRRKRKTPILKTNKKLLYSSSVVLSLFTTGMVSTNVLAIEWTPRTVTEIRPEIVRENEKLTYTVKYGDTLSAIASAMNIEMDTLAKINQIADINLIFPDTVLTTTVDKNNQVTQVEIEAPVQGNTTETVQATVDVAANQATIDNTVVNLEEVPAVAPVDSTVDTASQAIAETQATAEIPVAEVAAPVASAVETPAEAVAPVAPAVEVPAETAAPVVPAVEVPAETVVPVAPAAEAQAAAQAQAAAEA
ncbi:TPA: LysM peptidoglycan-binding domain-containing protein, partial [Streptococcus suis]|nr:LysM peptidoglycan-binding domain-containing protein [Streptococcus suis]